MKGEGFSLLGTSYSLEIAEENCFCEEDLKKPQLPPGKEQLLSFCSSPSILCDIGLLADMFSYR